MPGAAPLSFITCPLHAMKAEASHQHLFKCFLPLVCWRPVQAIGVNIAVYAKALPKIEAFEVLLLGSAGQRRSLKRHE